jgi:hypothetical protein
VILCFALFGCLDILSYGEVKSTCNTNLFVFQRGCRNEAELCVNLTFTGPCIEIYFYSKSNEMDKFLKFILFCRITLHVSDGFSVHHQESKIVHTASGICHTD